MDKIYCLFSVANNYDQPLNNLVIAWTEKPDFATFCQAFGLPANIGDMNVYDAVVQFGDIMKKIHLVYNSDYEQRIYESDYRFEVIESGKLLKQ